MTNPWRQHPALAGLPIPDEYLPKPWSWNTAVQLGLVYEDGQAQALRAAANPEYLPEYLHKKWKTHEGPIPELRMGGRITRVGNATQAVYDWLTEQARERARRASGNSGSVAAISSTNAWLILSGSRSGSGK